jgi:hypothetical protein
VTQTDRPTRSVLAGALAGILTCCAAATVAGVDLQPESEPPEPVGQPVVPPGPGEPPPPTIEEMAAQRPIVFELKARGELGFNADFRDAPGDVTVTRLGAGFGAAIPVRQFGQLDIGLDYEFSDYRFSGATGFAAGFDSPWGSVHRETLTVRYGQRQSLQLAWFVGGSVGFSHESGADLSDSLVGSAYGCVRYALSESLSVGGGLVVWSQLEDSPILIPLPQIDWWLNERVRLTTGGRLGLTLAYAANEDLTFSIGGEYELREFRLRDDGAAPDGVGRDRRVPIAAGIGYRPTRQLSVELTGGAYLWQQFRLLDAGGNTLSEIDLKPTPFASIQVVYRF